jgi:hypothetical protein
MVGVGHTSPPIWPCSDWGLPCRCCYQQRGGLLPHRFTLTLPPVFETVAPGGLFSVALSVALRRPGVTWQLPYGARTFLGPLSAPATTVLDQWVEDNEIGSPELGVRRPHLPLGPS